VGAIALGAAVGQGVTVICGVCGRTLATDGVGGTAGAVVVAKIPAVATLLGRLHPGPHLHREVPTVYVGGQHEAAEPRANQWVRAVLEVPKPHDFGDPLVLKLLEESLLRQPTDLRAVKQPGAAVEAVGYDRLDLLLKEGPERQQWSVLPGEPCLHQQSS